jgi:hypothetical protein
MAFAAYFKKSPRKKKTGDRIDGPPLERQPDIALGFTW